MSMAVGLAIGRKSASAAASTIRAIHPTATSSSAPGLRPRRTGETAAVSTPISSTAMADPGIEDGVKHVDDEVHDNEAHGDEQHDALQDDEVAGIERADQQASDA